MKVIHLNATLTGGAARACLRLHSALLKEGIDSFVWVQDTRGGVVDDRILCPKSTLGKFWAHVRPYLDKAPILLYPKRKKGTFNLGWLPFSQVVSALNALKPDIVHLHWLGRGVLPLRDLPKINAPLVWSLHDMWAFSGGDHYYDDENEHTYKHSCILNSPFERDLATLGFGMKQRAYAKIPHLCIVGVSSWISRCAAQSALLKDKTHVVIPNPIDIELYKPLDKNFCRQLLGLPTSKKLIGFGAMEIGNPIKGYDLLLEALQKLESTQIELVVFGASAHMFNLPFKVHYLGTLKDNASLVALYNALDVLIVPSRQEALGYTAMESLSCNTPVVAFAVSGLRDLVKHQENGYLAHPFDTTDLKTGIEWVLNAPDYPKLCAHARARVLERFSEAVVAKQYRALYEKIIPC
ncbi:glycosyltransferase [Helicobacter cynogastricus]|uniref:glycosyltransferase n=1 Tax=Helicobacter cynogastricus TaxID=329937 RepID=UPI000CF0A54D|nr:glycosyltransferase [Helicobacter cynogastricus]